MFEKIKNKIAKNKMQKAIGKQTLENIKKAIYEEFMGGVVTKGMTLEEFCDIEFWSDKWVDFLESTGLELLYDVTPICDKDKKVVDIIIEIMEI